MKQNSTVRCTVTVGKTVLGLSDKRSNRRVFTTNDKMKWNYGTTTKQTSQMTSISPNVCHPNALLNPKRLIFSPRPYFSCILFRWAAATAWDKSYSGLIWPDESQSGRGDGRQQQLRGSTQRLFPANVLPADQDGTPPVQLPPSVKPHGESAGAKPCKMAPNERTDAVLTLTNRPGNLSRQNISRCLCSSLGLDC